MIPDLDTIRSALGANGTWVIPVAFGVAIILGAAALITAATKIRGRSVNVKKTIGMGIVQAGTSYIIITGVYEFFSTIWHLPAFEAGILAVVVEASTWAGVGQIYAYAKTEITNDRGKKEPATGWGRGGPFFWFTILSGGTLAVLGSHGAAIAAGRVVIIGLGAWMWYLVLQSVTRPKVGKSQWRWTPRRLLIAVGALAPTGADLEQDATAWQIARLARAIRRRNSYWPWTVIGKRAMRRQADGLPEHVLAAAMRKAAAGHVLIEHTNLKTSPLMKSAIESVVAAQTAAVTAAPIVVVADVGPAISPRPPVEPPVQTWQREIDAGSAVDGLPDAPTSPAPAPQPGDNQQRVDGWRNLYAEAIAYVKNVWRDKDGRDWIDSESGPSLNAVVALMKDQASPWQGGKWTAKGTCMNMVAVLVADRARIAGAIPGEIQEEAVA